MGQISTLKIDLFFAVVIKGNQFRHSETLTDLVSNKSVFIFITNIFYCYFEIDSFFFFTKFIITILVYYASEFFIFVTAN